MPDQHNSFIYLLKGDIKIGKNNHDKTRDSQLILLDKGSELNIVANKNSEFLFIAGRPIGEKIARGGPFVMNTKKKLIKPYKIIRMELLQNINAKINYH